MAALSSGGISLKREMRKDQVVNRRRPKLSRGFESCSRYFYRATTFNSTCNTTAAAAVQCSST